MKFGNPIAVFLMLTSTLTIALNSPVAAAQDHFQSVTTTAKPASHPFAQRVPLQDSVKTVGTNLNAFGVPFKVNADNNAFVEVQLYLSKDMGQSWSFYGRQATDKRDFPFQADQDGEYWFSLKTLDRDRRLLPEGDPIAELKIIVDTAQPKLDFRIESDAAGRVVCRWNAQDKNLVPESFRILYQPIDSQGIAGSWQQVPVQLNGTARVGIYADQIAWWPETTERKLNVAVEIKDIAGNVVQVDRQVIVPETGWRKRSEAVAQITDQPRTPDPNASNWNSSEPSYGSENSAPSTGANQPTLDHTASKASPHPPNVICEDGVCRLAPEAMQKNDWAANDRAALAQNVDNRRMSPPAPDANTGGRQFAQMVGSESSFVPPPVPSSLANPTQQESRPTNQQTKRPNSSGAIVWKSESQKQMRGNQESVSTTVGRSSLLPDSSLAPLPNPRQQLAKPATNVPSNPATTREVGNQVVSESSTMGNRSGNSNQYRGLNTQRGVNFPAPELMPGLQSAQQPPQQDIQRQLTKIPQTSPNAGAEQWTHPSDRQAPSGFANAGFKNRNSAGPAQRLTARQQSQSVVEQSTPSGVRAAMQIIGSRRFNLDYGIDAIDPSGVAKVDLWITRDGRNWSAWGSDPDNQSPFPVSVEEDGRFGFRIVVHSKDGLTGQGPSTGEQADMWVLIDTQSPMATITSVPYGRQNEAGRLVINYSAADDRLILRPITLSYSANPKGPWIPIGEGLRNEGRHVWKPKSNVPDLIFLRIDALDRAGNVGVHMLPQPIDVSGLVPRGTIRGVSPVKR